MTAEPRMDPGPVGRGHPRHLPPQAPILAPHHAAGRREGGFPHASSLLSTGYTELLGSGRACPRVTLQCLLWGALRVLHLMVLQVLPVLTTLLTTPLLNSIWNSCQHHPDALGLLGHTWTKGKGQPHPSQSSLSFLHPIPVVGQLRATPETETGLSARLQCRL